MKYKGRVSLLLFSIIVSISESFFEKLSYLSLIEALFFAAIAFFVGWLYDKSILYRKQAEKSEKHNRELIEFSPEPILVHQNEKIVFANEKLAELMQLSSEQIIGKSIFDLVLPEYHDLVRERTQKLSAGDKNLERVELKIYGGQDKVLDIEVASAAVVYQSKPSIEVFLRDITARNRLGEESRKNEELYRFITENSTDIISYLNYSGVYEYISPSCQQLLEYSQADIVGKSIFDFFHPEEVMQIAELFLEAKDNFEFTTLPHRFVKQDGSYLWLETNARTLRNSNNELEGIVAVSRDITERVDKEKQLLETNERLAYLANMDGLTGIPNRRNFNQTLKNEWNRTMRHSMPLSALMIDIDCFKKFNDCYGHQAGDRSIKKIAKVLKETLRRPGDFVARYGGEEFIILLPGTDESGALLLAERLLTNVRNLKIFTNVSKVADHVTVSIGCATVIPSAQQKPKELIKQADQELYAAKASGRNQASMSTLTY